MNAYVDKLLCPTPRLCDACGQLGGDRLSAKQKGVEQNMPSVPVRPDADKFVNVQKEAKWGGYWGSNGRDLLVGTGEGEEINGGDGNDFIDAGGGNDRIYAGADNDTVLAGAGDDFVTGDDGNDWLEGGAGRDTLYGGTGNDTLSGGASDGDILSGGAGADSYVVRRGDGRDFVEGLSHAEGDKLDLTDFASVLGDVDTFEELVASGRVTGTQQWGGDTIIKLTATDSITIRWINPKDLRADQFVFTQAPSNKAPTDLHLSNAVINENRASGTTVGTLSALDPDAGDAAAFQLINDANGAFKLATDGRTLLTTTSFDFEAGPSSYDVTVRVTDRGGLSFDKVLTIRVGNVDEAVTAKVDRYQAIKDTVLAVGANKGVLANDLAPDGDKMAVAGTITTALGGTVQLAANGSFTYTPKEGAQTTDSFIYTLTDRDGSTAIGIVRLDGDLPYYPIKPLFLSEVANGTNGFKIIGENANDYVGWSVATAGDINGDGRSDIILGTWYAGLSYVVFGKAGGEAVKLSDVTAGQGGFKIQSEMWGRDAGSSVSSAGDVNGDGLVDLLVGASGNNNAAGEQAGAAYVIFGKADGKVVSLDGIASGQGGFKIVGENPFNNAGRSVSSAGDVNGDGKADLLVSSLNDPRLGPSGGPAYVVFGKDDGELVNLEDVAMGRGGFKIVGENAFDYAGFSVSSAGDINGDGRGDLILGALSDTAGGVDAGAAYVVFGKADGGVVNLQEVAAGLGGFLIIGENEGDQAGRSVSLAGDVNGDGRADLIVGASSNSAGGVESGAAYVVFGKADGSSVSLSHVAAGHGGFKIIGENFYNYTGWSVSSAGDLNGDGRADLLVGALQDVGSTYNTGSAYVVFGKEDGRAVSLADVTDGRGGFKIVGEKSVSQPGRSVSAAGDVNGDGYADLLVGDIFIDSDVGGAGAAYVIYGSSEWIV